MLRERNSQFLDMRETNSNGIEFASKNLLGDRDRKIKPLQIAVFAQFQRRQVS
jgi:hypothetical protein